MRIVLLLAAISCFGRAVEFREYRVADRVGRIESGIPFLALGGNWKATNDAEPRIMVRASKDGVHWSRRIRIEAAGDTCSELSNTRSGPDWTTYGLY